MSFAEDINKFNGMYGLPGGDVPRLENIGPPSLVVSRMLQFTKILRDEVTEGADIMDFLNGQPNKDVEALIAMLPGATNKEIALVMLMDWLGDIVVYATSEAKRYGINLDSVLEVIMQSNFSKLGADGLPIIKDGKVQKGPSYWKPEPKLLELLRRQQDAGMTVGYLQVADAEVKSVAEKG